MYIKQDSINKIYKFYKGKFTGFFICFYFFCVDAHIIKQDQFMTDPWDLSLSKSIEAAQFSLEVQYFTLGVVHNFQNFVKHFSLFHIHSRHICEDTVCYCLRLIKHKTYVSKCCRKIFHWANTLISVLLMMTAVSVWVQTQISDQSCKSL